MQIAKVNGSTVIRYPYTWADFVADNNNTDYGYPPPNILAIYPSTDAAKDGSELASVMPALPPTYDPITQSCAETTPAFVAGVWTQQWTIATLDADKIAENEAKKVSETQKSITAAIQNLLDTTAQIYEYDNINNVTGWAAFLPDAAALAQWGAACWLKSKAIRDDVLTGVRQLPTASEVLAEMPVFVIP